MLSIHYWVNCLTQRQFASTIKLTNLLQLSFCLSCACIFVCCLSVSSSLAQDNTIIVNDKIPKDKLKSAFLFKFFEHARWPYDRKVPVYSIGLVGASDEFVQLMEEAATTIKVRGKKFAIINIKSVNEIQGEQLQMLFVDSKLRRRINDISREIENTGTLLVTEESNTKRDVMINLIYPNERYIDFELNRQNVLLQGIELDRSVWLLGGTELDVAELFSEIDLSLDKAKDELAAKEKAIKLLEQRQENLNVLLKTKQNLIDEKVKKISDREMDIRIKEVQLSELSTRFNATEKDYLAKRDELQKNRDALDLLQIVLHEKESKVNELIKNISDNEATLGAQKNAIEQHLKLIDMQRYMLILTLTALAGFLLLVVLLARINNAKRRSNKQLEQAKNRAQQYLDIAGALIVVSDINGNILLINKRGCQIFGYDASEMIGKNIFDHYVPKQYKGADRKILDRILSEEHKEGEMFQSIILNKSGEQRDIIWSASLYRDELGKIKGFIASGEDYTDRLRIEEQRNRAKEEAVLANKSKTIFLSNMSHELRTPLNSIIGFAQVILQDADLNPTHKRNLQTINKSGLHLLSLINEVLDLSKIESGHVQIKHDIFDINGLLREILALFEIRAKTKELELSCYSGDEVLKSRYIKSDEGKIRQILINLIGNAIKYTEQGSVYVNSDLEYLPKEIDNETGLTSAYLKISVVDTGIGIASSEHEKIFNVFQQAGSHTYKKGGTGLGLAITAQYIDLLGGTIKLDSQTGSGSTFSFKIPVEVADDFPEMDRERKKKIVSLTRAHIGKKVLVADDVESNCELLSQILCPLGFRVKSANDGKQALEILKVWRPDIVIVDRVMPNMDGLEFTKTVRLAHEFQNIPIICISASVFESERQEVFDAGVDDFLMKPFKELDLLNVIHKQLGVEFLLSDMTTENSYTDEAIQRDIENFSQLPRKLLLRLSEAHEKKSFQKIVSVVADENSMIAIRLWELSDNFDFENMRKIIIKAKQLKQNELKSELG